MGEESILLASWLWNHLPLLCAPSLPERGGLLLHVYAHMFDGVCQDNLLLAPLKTLLF